MHDIEQEAAEAVSILYLETLHRAKNAEAATEEVRHERDDQYRRAQRLNILYLETLHRAKNAEAATEEVRHERDAFRELARVAIGQENELRRSLEQERAKVRRITTDLHCEKTRNARYKGALVKLGQEVDDVLGA
jgi:hypothetical protein